MEKLKGLKQDDPEWIKQVAEGLLDININSLSDSQRKMLSNHYLEYLREGLKPRQAMEKALQIVLCFK